MGRLLADPEQLRRTVLEHLYLGRRELVARAQALRFTYGMFLYGTAVAVLAFVVALVRG